MKFGIVGAAAAAALAFAFASSASAQDLKPTFYGNLGYSFIQGDGDVDLGAIHGRLGARLHPYFGVEGEAAFGVKDETQTAGANTATAKLSHELSAFAVAFLPLTPQADLFVRGGYGDVRGRLTLNGVSASENTGAWAYGGGAQYLFDGKNGLRAEYTRFDLRHDNGSADVWSVSYVRKF
jgi:opacity protein-like surface antigen